MIIYTDEELTEIRRELFDSLDSASTPKEVSNFQRYLTSVIKDSEGRKAQANDKKAKVAYGIHSGMCRSYGDALAWQLLHPHAIRQLSDLPKQPPPHLSGMKEVVEKYLVLVDRLADLGHYSFVVDLTNIIKVSDIAVVFDPEIPLLLEVKGDKVHIIASDFILQKYPEYIIEGKFGGRIERQMNKIVDITRYLATNSGEGPYKRRAITIMTQPEYYWDEVNEAINGAIKSDDCLVRISDRHWIYATRKEPEEIDFLDTLQHMIKRLPTNANLRVGCHLAPLESYQWHIAPPFNWHIDKEYRFALMEGSVSLFNFIDLSLLENHEYNGAVITEVSISDSQLGDNATHIEFEGTIHTLSSIFLSRLIYGFETVESVANSMLESVIKSKQA
jgi:hypothetical protein